MPLPDIQRRSTRPITIRSGSSAPVTMGGNAPVTVQSMTNTTTADAAATLAQIRELAAAGADIVRVAVPTRQDTAALKEIVSAAPVPIVADVHFHFDRALEAIDAGVAKIRLNPGNINDQQQVARVIDAAKDASCAIRVGVNEGSVVARADSDQRTADLQQPLADLMAAKLDEYLAAFRDANFDNLVLSAKSHDAVTTIAVNRLLAQRYDYPLHLGVTHAGTAQTGAIRSAAALGTLLAEGIGETIRISFAGNPLAEVQAAVELLCALRLRKRKGIELIACPTCGRAMMDIASVAEQVRSALADIDAPLTVAVMGCVVNGPGEADSADIALCAGKGKGILYSRGRRLRTVPTEEMVSAIVEEARKLAAARSEP